MKILVERRIQKDFGTQGWPHELTATHVRGKFTPTESAKGLQPIQPILFTARYPFGSTANTLAFENIFERNRPWMIDSLRYIYRRLEE